MAARHSPTFLRRSRALAVCAPIALCLTGVGANAQTVGPVANFGPAPLDLQNDAPAESSAQELREGASTPVDPESKPLLAAPRSARPAVVEGAASPVESSSAGSWTRVLAALGVVIALIFVVRFVVKRAVATTGLRGQFGAAGRAPSGVLEVLGRYPISRGQSLVLLRVDQRVLLLSQSGGGFRTLAHFDEPTDVASLLMKTRDEESESLSGRFKHMLSAFERDPSMTKGVEHVDLTRRAPIVNRAAAMVKVKPGAQRVATPPAAHQAIRQRLASLGEVA